MYTTIYLPTITYPLPATTLSRATLEKAQSMTTPLIISKMGYNQNMPKAVIYAPITHGGLGLKHLESEQGIQQVNQVLKHLHSNTTLGTLLQTTIQAYQIHAGISKLILEFTQDLPWLPNRWIMHLRKFLHSTNSSIYLTDTWTIPIIQQNDRHIMDNFQSVSYSTSDLQVLNKTAACICGSPL